MSAYFLIDFAEWIDGHFRPCRHLLDLAQRGADPMDETCWASEGVREHAGLVEAAWGV